MTPNDTDSKTVKQPRQRSTGRQIAVGLLLGVLCGILFGEYCRALETVGQAYVGLLQMTVLPYVTVSLVGKLGRLNLQNAKQLGLVVLVTLLVFSLIGVLLVAAVSTILPPIEGAAFYSPPSAQPVGDQDFLSMFIPANVYWSLSHEIVPAVVVFCVLFGLALIAVPGKARLLDLFDLCADGIGRINLLLVRLAPLGLFALTAAAAGTLRIEELSRLQAYLVSYTLACAAAALVALPLLVSGLTGIRYRTLLSAAHEPVLTAIATGKLFVVLPQIVEKCDLLLQQEDRPHSDLEESTPNVVIPLAYSFPHLGKILSMVFVSFAAWYVGRQLTPLQTTVMASTGAVTSFASPLVTIPFLLDRYHLPQDLMPMFIVPGFLTMRMGDMVGVLHLMALTVITTYALEGRLRLGFRTLLPAAIATAVALAGLGVAGRSYLASTTLAYDLDDRLLALDLTTRHSDVTVYQVGDAPPPPRVLQQSTLHRVREERTLRVGYHADHLPYSFLNVEGKLVGFDIELIHLLADELKLHVEFIPWTYDTVVQQLETGQIDVAVGGLLVKPQRMLRVAFTQPYQTATLAILVPDYRRGEIASWKDEATFAAMRIAVVSEDLAEAARTQLPTAEITAIESIPTFFAGGEDRFDGLILPAEDAAAWNVLHPEYHVVVPRPRAERPVGMAVRENDGSWIRFLDGWLGFERLDGTLDRLRAFWLEGGGTQERPPRWCVMRDVLHWLP